MMRTIMIVLICGWVAGESTASANWSDAFGPPGLSGQARAVIHVDDEVIVGGTFRWAGSERVNHIARWDGNRWRSLGGGTNGIVSALALYEGNVVAAGGFTVAGGERCRGVARWEGARWVAIGNGLDGAVEALAVFDGRLIAGGTSILGGGQEEELHPQAGHLAAWDGSVWRPIAGGVNAPVRALAVYEGRLVVGGLFTEVDISAGGDAGVISARHVTVFDGEVWEPLSEGLDGPVRALVVHGDDVVAGGAFGTAGRRAAIGVARWDGRQWHAMGAGFSDEVRALVSVDERLYAGGWFTRSGQLGVPHLAEWRRDRWMPVIDGIDGAVIGMGDADGRLIIVGDFTQVDGRPAEFIAQREGGAWNAPGGGQGLNGRVHSVLADGVDEGAFFAAGSFSRAGAVAVNNVARWTGSAWESLGLGTNATIWSMVLHDDRLVVGGRFTEADGVVVNHVASWDGSRWNALGRGLDGTVLALAVHRGDIVAGGTFGRATREGDGDVANGGCVGRGTLARWNGSRWEYIGEAPNGGVYALASVGGELVVGGEFEQVGNLSAKNVAVWDGSSWRALGSGLDAPAFTIAPFGDGVAFGGPFRTAGGTRAECVAIWDGTSWLGLDTQPEPPLGRNRSLVNAIQERSGDLIVGGSFVRIGGVEARRLARWDGTAWSVFGAGLDDRVNALTISGNAIVVGGRFTQAGDGRSTHIALWEPLSDQ